jgi:hypothetical protein
VLSLALDPKTPQNSQQSSQSNSRKQSTPNFQQNSHLNILNSDSPFASVTRSIYLGNLPLTCSVKDICDMVRGERGLESVRLLPAKSCAFIDFISRLGAERFISRLKRIRTRPQISGQEIKIGWAKEKPLQPTILKAIENGATRNVYLNFPVFDPLDGLLIKFNDYLKDSQDFEEFSDYFPSFKNDENSNEIINLEYPLVSFLYGIFDEFGPLDMVKVVPSRRIAFIHMAQVSDAMRAVAELSTRQEFKGKRLSFGRDRCGERIPESTETLSVDLLNHKGLTHLSSHYSSMSSFDYSVDSLSSEQIQQQQQQQQSQQSQGHRTVYLGGCNSPDLTIEDICDHIHTGQLQSVRLNKERKCAFITFINPEGAEMFLARALQFGLSIKNCQLKPAYAKENQRDSNSNNTNSSNNNSVLPVAISNALRKGYTRNLYLGNVDFSVLTESRLRTEMSRFGPLDRIQILKDRSVAFVHFANLLDCGRAFEQVKSDLCYKNCRVGFGKDRCEPSPHPTSNSAHFYNPAPVPVAAPVYTPYGYLPNYPPPPFYFHPMIYDQSGLAYPQPPPPSANTLEYPPGPYHFQSYSEATKTIVDDDPAQVAEAEYNDKREEKDQENLNVDK